MTIRRLPPSVEISARCSVSSARLIEGEGIIAHALELIQRAPEGYEVERVRILRNPPRRSAETLTLNGR